MHSAVERVPCTPMSKDGGSYSSEPVVDVSQFSIISQGAEAVRIHDMSLPNMSHMCMLVE